MGRLKALPARLGPMSPRLQPATIAETVRDRGGRWMKLRARILARDRGLCVCAQCAALGRLQVAAEVDHRIPLWAGGTDDESNLGAIAAECHKLKTGAESAMRARQHAPTGAAEWLEWIPPARP